MDLDEAIRYYSHLADECRRKVNIERYDYMDLKDLAAEHGQLADWLNELKVLREKIRVLLEKQEKDRWIPVIRCKDCKFRENDDFCTGRGFPYQLVPDDGFCDKGKRDDCTGII